jgi:hypothetical protein
MQRIDCLVALGSDNRNTVPKMGITVAEAHALRAIHGAEALLDVQPLEGDEPVSLRGEITRLREKYQGKDEDGRPIIEALFAGGGSSVPETVDDLQLPEQCFRTLTRVTAAPRPEGRQLKSIAPVSGEDDGGTVDHLFD